MRWTEFYGGGDINQTSGFGTGHFAPPDWSRLSGTPDPEIADLWPGGFSGAVQLTEDGLYVVQAQIVFGWAMNTTDSSLGNDILPDTICDLGAYIASQEVLT